MKEDLQYKDEQKITTYMEERECIRKSNKSERIKLNNFYNFVVKFSENFQENIQNSQ